MLWIICAAFLVLWLATMALSISFGGLSHLLLIAALAVMIFAAWQGRRPI